MKQFPFANIEDAVDFALRQSTKWGGSWTAYQYPNKTFGVIDDRYFASTLGRAVYVTNAPNIGWTATGEYTEYGKTLREGEADYQLSLRESVNMPPNEKVEVIEYSRLKDMLVKLMCDNDRLRESVSDLCDKIDMIEGDRDYWEREYNKIKHRIPAIGG
jgi:hypothetical protein